MSELTIELVHGDDCPHADLARAEIRTAMSRLGVAAVVKEWDSSDPCMPAEYRGVSSPTVFVNGVDVASDNVGAAPAGASCRVYTDDSGAVAYVPSAELILNAIAAFPRKRSAADGDTWLSGLPRLISNAVAKWSLTLQAPYENASCAWVAPAVRDVALFVLKIGRPHFEARDEIAGLRFWDGRPTVQMIDAMPEQNTMLLEACEPGTSLNELPIGDQDRIIAELLKQMWRVPAAGHPFRPLRALASIWWSADQQCTPAQHELMAEARDVFDDLTTPNANDVLLATDLHAGNVLRAQREPWLVIDPKPFVGDAAYDATQHLFNHPDELRRDPRRRIDEFATVLHVDPDRVRRWIFVRSVVDEPDDAALELARRLRREL